VACGLGLPDAEDCAADHWCKPLGVLKRERNGQWRANCPVPGCKSARSLEFDAPGKHVRWKSFCGDHDQEAVRPYLAKIIGLCMPSGRVGRAAIEHSDLIELALSDLPPQSMRLALLEMAGMSTSEALAKLGIGPTHKRRVIEPLRKLGRLPVSVTFRRSAELPVSVSRELPVSVSPCR
jgi:hypothetical protein